MSTSAVLGPDQLTTKLSPQSVPATVDALTSVIKAKGLQLFAVIDQRAAALDAGFQLRETTLVIFGSPAAGTSVMDSHPLAALDLPLKALVWDDAGQTTVTYLAPACLAARYELESELAEKLAGIDPITDAALASLTPRPRER